MRTKIKTVISDLLMGEITPAGAVNLLAEMIDSAILGKEYSIRNLQGLLEHTQDELKQADEQVARGNQISAKLLDEKKKTEQVLKEANETLYRAYEKLGWTDELGKNI